MPNGPDKHVGDGGDSSVDIKNAKRLNLLSVLRDNPMFSVACLLASSSFAYWTVFSDRGASSIAIATECLSSRAKVLGISPVKLLKDPFIDPDGRAIFCIPSDGSTPWFQTAVEWDLNQEARRETEPEPSSIVDLIDRVEDEASRVLHFDSAAVDGNK